MNNKKYAELIKRTDHTPETLKSGFMPRLNQTDVGLQIHYILGLTSEVGEVADALKKYLRDGKPLDRVNLIEEAGDILWYLTNMLTAIDSNLEEAMQANVNKLSKRYPNGFSEAGSATRNVEIERQVLEQTITTGDKN